MNTVLLLLALLCVTSSLLGSQVPLFMDTSTQDRQSKKLPASQTAIASQTEIDSFVQAAYRGDEQGVAVFIRTYQNSMHELSQDGQIAVYAAIDGYFDSVAARSQAFELIVTEQHLFSVTEKAQVHEYIICSFEKYLRPGGFKEDSECAQRRTAILSRILEKCWGAYQNPTHTIPPIKHKQKGSTVLLSEPPHPKKSVAEALTNKREKTGLTPTKSIPEPVTNKAEKAALHSQEKSTKKLEDEPRSKIERRHRENERKVREAEEQRLAAARQEESKVRAEKLRRLRGETAKLDAERKKLENEQRAQEIEQQRKIAQRRKEAEDNDKKQLTKADADNGKSPKKRKRSKSEKNETNQSSHSLLKKVAIGLGGCSIGLLAWLFWKKEEPIQPNAKNQ